MAIKQTIQYRLKGVVVGGQWRDMSEDGLVVLGSGAYEFRIGTVFPVGYKYKSRWGNTVYEVTGEPVTNKSQIGVGGEYEETIHYPVKAVEDGGREIWHEYEREDFILSREEVK